MKLPGGLIVTGVVATLVLGGSTTASGVAAAASSCKRLPAPISVTKTVQWCGGEQNATPDDGVCKKNKPVVRGRQYIYDCSQSALGVKADPKEGNLIDPFGMMVTRKGKKITKVTRAAVATVPTDWSDEAKKTLVRITITRPKGWELLAYEFSKSPATISRLPYSLKELRRPIQSEGKTGKPIAKVMRPVGHAPYVTVKGIGKKARWSMTIIDENGRIVATVTRKKSGWAGQTWYKGYVPVATLVEGS